MTGRRFTQRSDGKVNLDLECGFAFPFSSLDQVNMMYLDLGKVQSQQKRGYQDKGGIKFVYENRWSSLFLEGEDP